MKKSIIIFDLKFLFLFLWIRSTRWSKAKIYPKTTSLYSCWLMMALDTSKVEIFALSQNSILIFFLIDDGNWSPFYL